MLDDFKDFNFEKETPNGFFIFPLSIESKSESNDDEVGPRSYFIIITFRFAFYT